MRVITTLAAGSTFAGYTIERLLGAGGMGSVYLAQDRELPRQVALKLLDPSLTGNDGVRARFLREADTAARLARPNIVAVYARGEEQGQLWIAMQYVAGTDADVPSSVTPMPAERAVRIISETANALDYAHASGVLHRDVKPANILLSQGNPGEPEQVMLADFGIAKVMDETIAQTQAGDMLASLRYASPEQLDAHTTLDARTDVYSLGCTLFKLLTTQPPYPGETASQQIHGHLNLPVPRPTQFAPGIPPGLDAVIAHALAKDRDHRYRTAGEFAAAARQALTGPPPVPPSRPRPPRKLILVIALVLGLIVGTAAVAAVLLLNGDDSTSDAAVDDSTLASRAGCAYARALTNYTPTTLDQMNTSVLALTTGKAQEEWRTAFPGLRPTMESSQAISRSTVDGCPVKSVNGNRAEVTATVVQTMRSDTVPERTQSTVLELTMERADGKWLVSESKITPVK